MDRVHELCGSYITEQCSEKVHSYIGHPFERTKQCVEDSFKGKDHEKADNTIL